MKPYEFLPHTADTKIRAYGHTLEEAFQNCALATTAVITDPKKIQPTKKKKVIIESENLEALLYDFLEELLILLDSESFLLHAVKELKITPETNQQKVDGKKNDQRTDPQKFEPKKNNQKSDYYTLTAILVGDVHHGQYEISTHVKAITYEEMFIKEENNLFTIQFILDL